MKFEINDKKKCDIFIYIFNHLKNFTDKLTLNVSPEKLHIQGMDNSHICIYELFLQSDWFDTWEVNESDNFGIYLPTFNKILHICSDKQIINIHNNNDNASLNIFFTSDEKGEFNKFFQIPLMDIDTDMLAIPDTEYEVDIEIDSKKIKSLIDELSNFNDTLNIICNEEEITLESESDEGSMKAIINIDDIEVLAVIEDMTVESSFGIKYISQMCQFYKIADKCEIHISNGIPLLFKLDIDNESLIRFYVAPKIKD
tara:strand:+ start:413 stop:1180 length:768 start_codon:yes stop_codon:yes gene_type:complete